jgi:hypothetical protein
MTSGGYRKDEVKLKSGTGLVVGGSPRSKVAGISKRPDMKLAKVIALTDYRAKRPVRGQQKPDATKALSDQERLWELMEKNISIACWKKGI